MGTINRFRGDYKYLSNFYNCDIKYEGLTFKSVEAAFQAMKVLDKEERKKFQNISPKEAKRLGRQVKLRPDWEEVKVSIMKDIIYRKFKDSDILRQALLNTGDLELIEGNTWGDTFWGVSHGEGRNTLGKILMDTRKQLREER